MRLHALTDASVRRWLGAAIVALALSGIVQRRVEERRVAANLTWSDPDKHALEVGFLALGGFRGILADILWVRAIRHQDAARYYELKLLCDMILKLQPTFTQVHAFQAYNMSYNLAYHAESGEDKWYWVRSGIMTLEKGLERNYRNYSLWFELGYQYLDRLSDAKASEFREMRQRDVPNINELTDEEIKAVFLHEDARKARWAREGHTPQPTRPNEHLRYAAYYFWEAMKTGTDPVPLRTERVYGDCIEKLGHWYSKEKDPAKRTRWEDWGAEDWWVEVWRRNREERGAPQEDSVPTNLKFCLYQQMYYYVNQAETFRQAGKTQSAETFTAQAVNAHARYARYFPGDTRSLDDLLKAYDEHRARLTGLRSTLTPSVPEQPEHP